LPKIAFATPHKLVLVFTVRVVYVPCYSWYHPFAACDIALFGICLTGGQPGVMIRGLGGKATTERLVVSL